MKLREYIFKSIAVLLFISAGLTYVVMSEDDETAIVFDIKNGSEVNLPDHNAEGKDPIEQKMVEKASSAHNNTDQESDGHNSVVREAADQNGIDREAVEFNGVDQEDVLQSKNKDNTDDSDDLVDINSADETRLTSLPGIGPSKADAIIEFRNDNGRFDSIEELMLVPGIKEGTFNKLKDLIKAE
ncbi:MAG: helix-hairpin-helix domain-containing protein [Lachnospiraceae bacterium]|nr:helix-hairpin-helix domain-containing protein [Lachnospiraceae bacterium]